jgi:hypothetical protein
LAAISASLRPRISLARDRHAKAQFAGLRHKNSREIFREIARLSPAQINRSHRLAHRFRHTLRFAFLGKKQSRGNVTLRSRKKGSMMRFGKLVRLATNRSAQGLLE